MLSMRVLKVILVGCLSMGLLAQPARAASEVVVHAFQSSPNDGRGPYAGLIDVGGTLYGTTFAGGASDQGTVFKVTKEGVATVLHSFGSGGDGLFPFAALIKVGGTLYSTTHNGGSVGSCRGGCGTVFSITTEGVETVLHSFGSENNDGLGSYAGLIDVDGTLYGTTQGGGTASCSCGTVFKITTKGIETVLHSFKGGSDGAYPQAGLINVGGTLYGTTIDGGAHNGGMVFKITTAGVETVLHSFGHGRDGSVPQAGLINVGGTLYGTTQYGGSHEAGTVFSITTAGAETVLHSFGKGSDGSQPGAGLIDVGGTLYGTTEKGGAHEAGTVFGITTAGVETVLYSFKGGSDGANPQAGLINVGSTLYGTTVNGGASGYGTVFKVTP